MSTAQSDNLERNYYAVLAAGGAIWDLNIDSGVLFLSEMFYTITGYTNDRKFKSLEWFIERVHTEDYSVVKNTIEEIKLGKTATLEIEYRFRNAFGKFLHFLHKSHLIFESGKFIRIISVLIDITKYEAVHLNKLKTTKILSKNKVNLTRIEVQEYERSRLAAELHDNVNQLLVSAFLYMGIAKINFSKSDYLEKPMKYIQMAIESIRLLCHKHNSTSIIHKGFQKCVDDIAYNMAELENISLDINIEETLLVKLDDNKQLMLLRIIQEQTNNILKYAGANEVKISLCRKGHKKAELLISDDGKGFDKNQIKGNGMGFININSRALAFKGSVDINSEVGKGCAVSVEFPI